MSSTVHKYESGDSLPPLKALFGKVRRTILTILFRTENDDFYVRELARMVDGGQGAVQRELLRLLEAGLVERRRRGRQLFYRANKASPFFKALKELVAPMRKKEISPMVDEKKEAVDGKQLERSALSWLQQKKPYLG